jgi:hypothetical protein
MPLRAPGARGGPILAVFGAAGATRRGRADRIGAAMVLGGSTPLHS